MCRKDSIAPVSVSDIVLNQTSVSHRLNAIQSVAGSLIVCDCAKVAPIVERHSNIVASNRVSVNDRIARDTKINSVLVLVANAIFANLILAAETDCNACLSGPHYGVMSNVIQAVSKIKSVDRYADTVRLEKEVLYCSSDYAPSRRLDHMDSEVKAGDRSRPLDRD
jgi:hypothetical protein